MVRQFLPISALLLGSAFLLFAGGINGLILPLRGSLEGFSEVSLGLLGTGWAVGYVLGCFTAPRIVSRAGHIRSFGVMSALAGISILGSALLMTPWAWIPLRSISGFCFAGAAMIVESWLSERADKASRGKVFGIYTMVNLFASTGGQMSLTLGDAHTFTFFALGAIFYSLALVPTALSAAATPRPLVSVSLDVGGLWRNSPVAVAGVFLVGISNSAFGTLSAVYADRVGLMLTSVALFASLPVLAGAAAQIPVGILSDRLDRRKVLAGVAAVAMVSDLGFILLHPRGEFANLALASLFGAAIFAMYPVILAHANDHAAEGTALQVSGGLLMVFGIGGIFGPFVAGVSMAHIGTSGLFLTSIAAHVTLIVFAIVRITLRESLSEKDKGNFMMAPPTRTVTPETLALKTGVEEAEAPSEGSEPEPAGAME